MSTIVLITAGKRFGILSVETNTFGISTTPVPTARQPLYVPLLSSEILACPP